VAAAIILTSPSRGAFVSDELELPWDVVGAYRLTGLICTALLLTIAADGDRRWRIGIVLLGVRLAVMRLSPN